MALDKTARGETQLAAMSRYQALVRQLDLQQEHADGEVETESTTRQQWPRAVS